MKPAVIIVSIVSLIILIMISIFSGIFSFWGFVGLIFYIFLYIGGYFYIIIGMRNREVEQDTTLQRHKKFEWAWERINIILKSMAGGEGVEWASGFGRRSSIKSYYDGIQNKPFRSVIAHLENSQQLVMIIYDIDGDDIAEFIANPSPELIDNPFLNFKPFNRGVDREGGLDRFGGYNSSMRYPQRGRTPSRPSRGISINVDDGGFGDLDPDLPRDNPKLKPDKSIVDNALGKLRK